MKLHAAAVLWSCLLFGCAGAAPNAAAPVANQVAEEQSVRPGINENFLDPELDVARFVDRFEGDNREVFVHRGRIAGLCGVQPGMRVADIGAGTGLYTRMFAGRVGEAGRVHAVEIAPRFIDHLRQDCARRGLDNVEVVLCTERSVELPDASVDLVFVCDTYHHFEYPAGTMGSIHRALRPGGELVVVDFERIPGVTRQWLLDHVRAGRKVVEAEIEAVGFEKIRQEETPWLRENYILRFRRP